MARNFDFATGPSYVTTSIGNCGGVGNGAYTIICLFNPNGNDGLISFRTSGITAQIIIDTGQLFGAGDFQGGQTGISSGTWYWCAIRKASGSSPYQYSLRTYNSGSTAHQTGSVNHADSGSAATSIRLGDGDNRGNGSVAVWAAWTSVLSDAAVASMFTTAAADIAAQSPQGLWLGNQASSSNPINDSTSGHADQTALTGTVSVVSDPPGYNYTLTASQIWVPVNPPRRRTQPPRRRRQTSPATRAQIVPPAAVTQPQRRRLRLPIRRAFVRTPVPQQVIAQPPAYVPMPVRARLRGWRIFRSRIAAPIPQPQAPIVPPAYVPLAVQIRTKLARARNTHVAGPAPAQIVVQPPAYPPSNVRARLRGVRPRKATAVKPTPAQIVIPPPAYPPRNVRKRLLGLPLWRPKSRMPVQPGLAPVPPTPPTPTPTKHGSWYQLLGIVQTAREDHDQQKQLIPQACPLCGEPLRVSPDGLRFCAYDAWTPEGQPNVRAQQRRDWGGLQSVIRTDRNYASQAATMPFLSCPNDGEPLSISRDGVIFCRYDSFQPRG